ncbi:hypothetical protein [Nonomuraea typhae]|uniref:hypothetical protein n=1 Tax=Nonomuraea typhae TaxID=2603600 RepID=UPI0012FAFD97|nr:hypothetical protein [Nonomuraea typhae]
MNDALINLDECLSPHVTAVRRGSGRLRWNVVDPYGRPVRVIEWTCACRATVYELCLAGGRAFIRRTVQGEPVAKTHETDWASLRQTREIWGALLAGYVR